MKEKDYSAYMSWGISKSKRLTIFLGTLLVITLQSSNSSQTMNETEINRLERSWNNDLSTYLKLNCRVIIDAELMSKYPWSISQYTFPVFDYFLGDKE